MDKELRQKRLRHIIVTLEYLDESPETMQILKKILWRNASEYSCSLNSETSIYRIPDKFFKGDELLSKVDAWEVFKKEWYKDLSSNYPESWIPIADFQSEKDKLFVDISQERLPVIIAKYWSRKEFEHKELCDSLKAFVSMC